MKFLPRTGLELRRDLADQRFDVGLSGVGIRAIGGGVLRVQVRQFRCNHVEPDARVLRVEPSVRVVAVVVMAMRVMIVLFMIVLVVVLRLFVVMFVVVTLMVMLIVIMIARVLFALVFLVPVRAVVMAVRLEGRAFAKLELGGAIGFRQFDHMGILGQSVDRAFQPRFQPLADPEHRIGPLEGFGLGGAQRIAMRRRAGLYQKVGRADPIHHNRHKRVDRRDIRGNRGHLGGSGAGETEGGHGAEDQFSGHEELHVML